MEINFSSDDEVDDGLNDFVMEVEPTAGFTKKKYNRKKLTNSKWKEVFRFDNGSAPEYVGREQCLEFINSKGNFTWGHNQNAYGTVYVCDEHIGCDSNYRFTECANGEWIVSSNNIEHTTSTRDNKVGINHFFKPEVSIINYQLRFYNMLLKNRIIS